MLLCKNIPQCRCEGSCMCMHTHTHARGVSVLCMLALLQVEKVSTLIQSAICSLNTRDLCAPVSGPDPPHLCTDPAPSEAGPPSAPAELLRRGHKVRGRIRSSTLCCFCGPPYVCTHLKELPVTAGRFGIDAFYHVLWK